MRQVAYLFGTRRLPEVRERVMSQLKRTSFVLLQVAMQVMATRVTFLKRYLEK